MWYCDLNLPWSKFQLLRENWSHACMASRSLDRSGQGFYYYFRVLARDILCKNEFRTQCGLKQISQNESNPETLNMEWQEISDYHLVIVLFIKRYRNEVTLVDAIILLRYIIRVVLCISNSFPIFFSNDLAWHLSHFNLWGAYNLIITKIIKYERDT